MTRGSPRGQHRWRPRRDCGSAGGFTLLEAVVVLLLLSLVVAGVLPLLTTGDQVYGEARRSQGMLRNANVAVEHMVRDLRAAVALREAADGVLRLELPRVQEAGKNGVARVVEYRLAADGHLTYWWSWALDTDARFRRQLTVQAAPGQKVPRGYNASFCLDHRALVSQGKSLPDGRDVRVWYWDGTRMWELDRILDPSSQWNSTSNSSPGCLASQVKIWFRVQRDIPAGGADGGYFVYYGAMQAGPPLQDAERVLLEAEDGSSLDGWVRRDSLAGSYAASASGFHFTANSGTGFRQLSRSLPAHRDVEVIWRFTSLSVGNNRRQVGVAVRLQDDGIGYWLVPGETISNNQLRLRRASGWGSSGTILARYNLAIQPNTAYWARFEITGPPNPAQPCSNSNRVRLRGKVWQEGSTEPATWQIDYSDGSPSCVRSGNHIALVNGSAATSAQPLDHLHQLVWVIARLSPEPVSQLGQEEQVDAVLPPAQPSPEPLAGVFDRMLVRCFKSPNHPLDCREVGSVSSLEVRLVARDPEPDPVRGPVRSLEVVGHAAVRPEVRR